MATTLVYGKFVTSLLNKEIDFDTDTIKVALATSSYTPNQDTDDYFNDVVANEVSGTGYTAGGATLGSKTIGYTAGTNVTKVDGADTSWTSSTITARYAIIYDASPATDATRPLIAYVDFGSDQTSTAGTFTISWHADGIFTITVA